jgi:hypothetical protein
VKRHYGIVKRLRRNNGVLVCLQNLDSGRRIYKIPWTGPSSRLDDSRSQSSKDACLSGGLEETLGRDLVANIFERLAQKR